MNTTNTAPQFPTQLHAEDTAAPRKGGGQKTGGEDARAPPQASGQDRAAPAAKGRDRRGGAGRGVVSALARTYSCMLTFVSLPKLTLCT